jgi:uncharacterized cupin superfamily protein
VPRFNLERASLQPHRDAPAAFDARSADIGSQIGGEWLGGTVIELAPGKRAFPYHWEAAQEEWLLVLAGTATVRTPEGETALGRGDLVCFPVGPQGAHAVVNRSDDEPCRVLMLSNRADVNVIGYPDSGKIGVRTPWSRPNLPESSAIPYWEGEG